MKKQPKKRLFIVAGIFTTAIAAALIKQLKFEDDDNYLVSIAPLLYENVDEHTKKEAEQIGLFKQILFYFDYCPPKQNYKDEKSHIFSFDLKRFRNDINHVMFDEIYSIYIHGAANHLFNQYPKADLYFVEDGTATYLKMDNAEKINKRAKKIYTLNYFNKIEPFVSLYEGLKSEQIDKNIVRTVFEDLAKQTATKFEPKEKSVIFCTQNISINPTAMTYQAEFDLYAKNIVKLLNKGYFVYFKEHPKTPNMFYKHLKKAIQHPNFVCLDELNVLPIETLIPILKPSAIVSMFSSSLLTAPWIFDVPSFTFFAENEFKDHQIFGISHMMVAAYIPHVDSINKDLKLTIDAFNMFMNKTEKIKNNAIYRIKLIDFFKLFISKREFYRLKKQYKKSHKFLLRCAYLNDDVIQLFEEKNYIDYLIHYAESLSKLYQAKMTAIKKQPRTLKTGLALIKDGIGIILKLIL